MKAVVTGAAGFIGSHLAEKLLIMGHDVIGIDSFSGYYDPAMKEINIQGLLKNNKFNLVRKDILDTDIKKLLEGADLVFHEAAQPGVRASYENVDEYIRSNIFATAKLLDAVKGSKVKKVILASSSSVYGELSLYPFKESLPVKPISPYAMTKLKAEELCHMYHQEDKVPAVILRYFTVYGPRQRPDMAIHGIIRSAITGEKFTLLGDGSQERDFTFVADAVTATIRAAETGKPGEIYNIGSGIGISMLELIKNIEFLTGKKIKLEHQEEAKGDMKKTLADISKAKRDLGYNPAVALKEGLMRQIEWMKKSAFNTKTG